jgi:hypothetical protein
MVVAQPQISHVFEFPFVGSRLLPVREFPVWPSFEAALTGQAHMPFASHVFAEACFALPQHHNSKVLTSWVAMFPFQLVHMMMPMSASAGPQQAITSTHGWEKKKKHQKRHCSSSSTESHLARIRRRAASGPIAVPVLHR